MIRKVPTTSGDRGEDQQEVLMNPRHLGDRVLVLLGQLVAVGRLEAVGQHLVGRVGQLLPGSRPARR